MNKQNPAVSTVTQREIAVSGFNERMNKHKTLTTTRLLSLKKLMANNYNTSEIRKAGDFKLGCIKKLAHTAHTKPKHSNVTLRSA